MTRRNVEEGRRPRRFDPKQRGQDFARTRTRRKRGQTEQTPERRVDQLETWSFLNTNVATQAAATTLIEVVTELPEPSYLDIGRQIILRSPTAVHDILYVGMQLSDDTVAWIQWTTAYEDSPNSPGFAWLKNYSQGTVHRGVHMDATYLYFTRSTQDVVAYTLPSGSPVFIFVSGIPSGSNAGYGLYAETGPDRVWTAVPGINKVEYWNGTSLVTSASTQNFWALANDVAGSRILTTDRSGNRCTVLNKTTLAVSAHFATDCLTPEGIASDAAGNIYVADTGNNRMRKYNSSLTLQLNWGSSGVADGLFNAPKGVAVDPLGRVYVCDSGNNRVQVFTSGGIFIGKFGIGGTGNGELSGPNDITISSTGIVVNDFGNNRLSFWTYS